MAPRPLNIGRISNDPLSNQFMDLAVRMFQEHNGPEDPSAGPVSYGYAGSEFSSSASAPQYIKNCKKCCTQYRPLSLQKSILERRYAAAYSDDEAQKIINDYLTAVTVDLRYVRRQLHEHGDSILERWQKRNPQKRAELVRAAMPEMYNYKWLEAYLFFDDV